MALFYKKISSAFKKIYLSKLDIQKTGGSSFDSDAAAYFAALTAVSATPDATFKTAWNTAVLDLKANGLWTLIDRIYPLPSGDWSNLSAIAICAKSLMTATVTNTPTLDGSWGVLFDGATTYMRCDLQVNQLPSVTTTSAMLMVSFTNVTAPSNAAIAGSVSGTGYYLTSGGFA